MPTAGQIIRASDVAVQACRATRTVAQSITDNTVTTVAFDDELFDTDGMHSVSVNNSRITIVTAGFYMVGFNGTFAAGSDYVRTFAELVMNVGATSLGRNQTPGTSTSVQQTLHVSCMHQFDAGDYIEVQIYQDNTAGAARNLEVTADRSPQFWAARIGS